MKKSYIDYAMSVIVGRALPDVKDGLKPVQRRILYAMYESGTTHDKPYKKSARTVGDVLGKYHPHGESAIYDALVRMAQDFSMRYMLIDGQGNFGSVDGDVPAAMRYTEARLSKIAGELLEDIEKETVPWVDNFDASLKEPVVLPSKLPNLLVNGSSGIAVGMATNIPPHNLTEIVDGIVKYIEKPDVTIEELMEIIKGPDFPTGGIIYGTAGIREAYTTGKGIITIRAKTKIEEVRGKKAIVVTEIPYTVNKAQMLEKIAELVKDKKIDGIVDLRDESDREGMRVVIELRKDAMEEIVLNQLFVHTQMEFSFGIINLALVNNVPKLLNLKEMIHYFVEHRVDVVTKRSQYELRKAEERAHILNGLIIALENIDETIRIIRKARTVDDAKKTLMARFLLSEEQAKAILDMRLQKLTGMEVEGVRNELAALNQKIAELKDLLSSREKILGVIKKDLLELKEKYGDERRTQLEISTREVTVEDLIPDEPTVILFTNTGYIKRMPVDSYRMQRRGGKGLIGMETKEEDYIIRIIHAMTHDNILFFTTKGKVYQLKAYEIPQGERYAKGKAIVNLLPKLEQGERVLTAVSIRDFDDQHYLVFATRRGLIKKTMLSEYANIRSSGIIAINLEENDELIDVRISEGNQEVILATADGLAVRFSESDVRATGRATYGVIGIRLNEGDYVVSMATVEPGEDILSVTENGYGKRTPLEDYRKTRRGGKGVITIVTNERNGRVVRVLGVTESDEIIVTSHASKVIRTRVAEIPKQGRNTMGARVMRLDEGEKVIAVAKLAKEEDNADKSGK
ncbi:MAG: DNA gyrase subunit A [Thermoplasmata archaeon]|nr:DNA gyrase subunit A [Thermoplasmata archaeon]